MKWCSAPIWGKQTVKPCRCSSARTYILTRTRNTVYFINRKSENGMVVVMHSLEAVLVCGWKKIRNLAALLCFSHCTTLE